MPEIKPDLSDENRCVSVHWNLPVQCVLPASHRENWHEAWHPRTRNRIRYRRSFGTFRTEELNDGWHDLQIPPPGGYCNDERYDRPGIRCTEQYGHGWYHHAVVDGCRHSWNTPIPGGLNVDQLTRDVRLLRGMAVEAHSRIAELETAAAAALRSLSAFIFDSTDPGTEALGAQWLLQQAMPQADDPFAQPNRYRDEILCEAAKRQRAFIDSDDYVSDDWEAAYSVVDLIDPDEQATASEGGAR